ncbi:cell division protein FtsL [Virgibacillus oceani]|uniref:Cell division protein FtsL n=1 Tax=Virgibacillus oceani TaxID=1479511 RepID=A0A917LZU0_9BACI|nr:cell division protein FtsL [Virgibacillus oceani]GGG69836.1 cell division protein FtsL [Virgibacillus oceani]
MSTNQARSFQPTHTSHSPQREKQVAIKVRKSSWITKGEKVLYTVVGVCLILAGIFIVSFSSSTDSVNREIQSLERTIQTQKVENDGLKYEKKELSRPERIIKIAKENGLKIQDSEVKHASLINK